MNKQAFIAYRQAAQEVELVRLPPPPAALTATLYLPQLHTLVAAFQTGRLWLLPKLGDHDPFLRECEGLASSLAEALERHQLHSLDGLPPGLRTVQCSLADLRHVAATMHRLATALSEFCWDAESHSNASWCAALGNSLFEVVAQVEEADNLVRLKVGRVPSPAL